MFRTPRVGRRFAALTTAPLFTLFTTSASAQTAAPSPDPNAGAVTVTGSFDLVSTYMFSDTTKFFNGADGSKVIGSVGIGFSC